ncbi:N-acetyl-alpha-D-glucosaminyl L-malate synthase BshA [Wenyingzhuangia sp. 2_MG-2023]|uniref:N-acetyl-alpha-D-glucosaminyl L-malate synthase BshA n=1 Tax=Wenyingzhuangia sp. 2_MG-2023 TaxID=3062639 RepID=UPI0026E37F66|nr:N-acetyl-alpha-D-glucosaminyl L-malate synthase BshA [Wenyingzhuangia sp. 2_MG-2023]MDO6736975.1 N-acetyl-alpha-D-glucosaminyl L-malate synthase BshA [Wenyingzhuangia sp. 2_MG-2023]MDO6801855.1 N-acetyl-alpha-D-glucosaminyl L-malate synthase BshA [Wenyingzhuangia sp. 1_MG-2023]
MRIGIVCYPTFGGSGVVATELGMALAKKGYEIHFITYKPPVRLDLISSGIHFHQVQIQEYSLFQYQPYELALSSRMVEVVEKYKLEVLHVHYAIPHAYAAYMAKQMLAQKGIEVRVVTTLHGTDITLVGSHPNYKTAVEFSINNSDVVTSVSNSLREDTYRLFDIKREIEVVYNFIEIEQYENHPLGVHDCQRGNIANNDEFILTHISNYRPVKRASDVVIVFAKVLEHKPAKLVLVGEGPEMVDVKRKAKELGVFDKIVFLGNSTEVATILCYSDVFLLPSQSESFGLAALEAMAAKTPVISSNTGGLPEVNIHGVTGFLSNVGDVDDMALNTLKLIENKETLEKYKQNALDRASTFSIDAVLPKYEAIYKGVLVS